MISISLKIKVIPQASENKVVGWMGDVLKVKVKAPPEDGKANAAIRSLLVDVLELPLRSVILQHGFTSREKVFLLEAPNASHVFSRLPLVQGELLPPS